MPHVVLIGDSIFDNAAYTRGGPDVVSQVRGLLPRGWEATGWPLMDRRLIMLRVAASLRHATTCWGGSSGNHGADRRIAEDERQ